MRSKIQRGLSVSQRQRSRLDSTPQTGGSSVWCLHNHHCHCQHHQHHHHNIIVIVNIIINITIIIIIQSAFGCWVNFASSELSNC